MAFVAVVAVLAIVAIVRSRNSSGGGGDQRFEGMYTSSFETSSFVPCGSGSSGGPRYWLVWSADSDFARAHKENNLGPQGGTVYVRVRGNLETGNPNGYGHLGGYQGQLRVTALEEMSRERTC